MEVEHPPAVSESNSSDSIPIPVIRENCPETTPSNISTNVNAAASEGSINIPVEQENVKQPTPPVENYQEAGNPMQAQSEPPKENVSPQTHEGQEQIQQQQLHAQSSEAENMQREQISQEQKGHVPSEKPQPPVTIDKAESQPEKIDRRNHSDIFSLKKNENPDTCLFTVGGIPSRPVYRRRDVAPNNVFPEQSNSPSRRVEKKTSKSPVQSPRTDVRNKDRYHEARRPSSSLRNPLTGAGIISNDEYRFRRIRKKDLNQAGNPVLGVGYPEQTTSTPRIPPGGFSHGLW
ncbi:unnamed protein product [Phyllotreta striolata]|uniref:Microtubule-associated protein Jupiter n=1 Tax=Phyllotreta striolata TaxID=444603 RepID=A0A9N9TV54_PHYSR|nr:unnamed protein product [Phyllotreta striolata]